MLEQGLGQLAVNIIGDITKLIDVLKTGRGAIQQFARDAIKDLNSVESKLKSVGVSSIGIKGEGKRRFGGGSSASNEVRERERILGLEAKLFREQGRLVEAQEKLQQKALSVANRLKRTRDEIVKTEELFAERISSARKKMMEAMSGKGQADKVDKERLRETERLEELNRKSRQKSIDEQSKEDARSLKRQDQQEQKTARLSQDSEIRAIQNQADTLRSRRRLVESAEVEGQRRLLVAQKREAGPTEVASIHTKNAEAIRRAKIEQDKFTNATEETAQAISRLTGMIQRMIGAFIIYKIINGFRTMIQVGLDFNATMEGTQAGIAGLLISVKNYTDVTTGKAASSTLAFGAALKEAGSSMNLLQQVNLETAATLPEILTQYQQLIATMGGIKDAIPENLAALTKRFSVLGQMFMIPQYQMMEEIRSATTGAMKPTLTRILPFFVGQFQRMGLQGTPNEIIKGWRASGTEVENFLKILRPMEAIAKKLQGTWAVAISNLKDLLQMLLGTGFKPLFEYVRDNVNIITEALKDPKEKEKLLAGLRGINSALVDMANNAKFVGGLLLKIFGFGKIGEGVAIFVGWAIQIGVVALALKGLILLFHLLRNAFKLTAAEGAGLFAKFSGLWVALAITAILELKQHWEWLTEKIKEATNAALIFFGLKAKEPEMPSPKRISAAFEATRAQTAKKITDLEKRRDELLKRAPEERQEEIQAKFQKEITEAKKEQLKSDIKSYDRQIKILETEKEITKESYQQKINKVQKISSELLPFKGPGGALPLSRPGLEKEKTRLEQEQREKTAEFDRRIVAAKEEREILNIVSDLSKPGKDLEQEKEINEWRTKRLHLHRKEIEALEEEKKATLALITNEKVRTEAALYYNDLIAERRFQNARELAEMRLKTEETLRRARKPEEELEETALLREHLNAIETKRKADVEYERWYSNSQEKINAINAQAKADEVKEIEDTKRRIMKREIEATRSSIEIAKQEAETRIALGEWATTARITQIDKEIIAIRRILFLPLPPGVQGPLRPRPGVVRSQLQEGMERIAELQRERPVEAMNVRQENLQQLLDIFATTRQEIEGQISLGEKGKDALVAQIYDEIASLSELKDIFSQTPAEVIKFNAILARLAKERAATLKEENRENINLEKQRAQLTLSRGRFEVSEGTISRRLFKERLANQIALLEKEKEASLVRDPQKVLQVEQEILALEQEYASLSINIWRDTTQAIGQSFLSAIDDAKSFGDVFISFFRDLAKQIRNIFLQEISQSIVEMVREALGKGKEGEKKGLGNILGDILRGGESKTSFADTLKKTGGGGLSGILNWFKSIFGGGTTGTGNPPLQGPPLPGTPGLPGGAQGPTNPNAPGGPAPGGGGMGGIGAIGTAGAMIGQMIGGRAGGAISGASTGAMIGSVAGPPGMIAGAVAGGLLGGIFGGDKKKKDPIRAAIRDWWISTAKPALEELKSLGFGKGIFEGMTGSGFVKSLGWGKGIPQAAIENMKQAAESLKDTLADALERGFSAGTSRSGFLVFLRNIRKGIAEFVTQGLIDGVLKGKALTELFAPIYETVSTAVTKAIQFAKTEGRRGAAISPQAFQQQIMTQWAAISPVLNNLQPLFTSLFTASKEFSRTIGRGPGLLWEGIPSNVLSGFLGNIKQAHTGGLVTKSGLLNVKQGEEITSSDEKNNWLSDVSNLLKNAQQRISNKSGLLNVKQGKEIERFDKKNNWLSDISNLLKNAQQGTSSQLLSNILDSVRQANSRETIRPITNTRIGNEGQSNKRSNQINTPVTVYANITAPMDAVKTGTGIAWGLRQELRGSF